MTWLSGELARMACAISLSKTVLPARGGDTISARWPRPSGVMRSIARALMDFVTEFSKMMRSSGNIAVSASKFFGGVQDSVGMPSISRASSRARNFSRSRGART